MRLVALYKCYICLCLCLWGRRVWGVISGDVPTIPALVDRADDKLFKSPLHNPRHVLINLMLEETVCSYELRHKRHNRELVKKLDSGFIIRMIYEDVY